MTKAALILVVILLAASACRAADPIDEVIRKYDAQREASLSLKPGDYAYWNLLLIRVEEIDGDRAVVEMLCGSDPMVAMRESLVPASEGAVKAMRRSCAEKGASL